jgi:mannose-6-phosphate isomerase-like protein (cupin superfamily)
MSVPDEAPFATGRINPEFDVLAPDGSEIRLVGGTRRGSMAHGTLPAGGVSLAVVHRTVEEIWYVLGGRAEIWRSRDGYEETVEVSEGSSVTIPVGTHFQFRTIGPEPFRFIMCTMPPWPGEAEAVRAEGRWPSPE